MTKKRRIVLNLDVELIREAQQILGMRRASETIHRALMEAVAQERRRQALAYDFVDLTPESLQELREGNA